MSDTPLLLERRGHVALLTLNRPATRNALSGEDAIDAGEALRIGLVSRVVAAELLLAEALALAERIAANAPQVLRWTKQLLQQARAATLDEALDAAGRLQGLAHHTRDHAEAVTAFFEKRAPVFTGAAP
ncbi:MAG TPA: enoyl-CoA hydratase-related protein [Ramlibacter sp.]|nr:enoyl-CoA hydratase-related protein [Ramlibacter sp.]